MFWKGFQPPTRFAFSVNFHVLFYLKRLREGLIRRIGTFDLFFLSRLQIPSQKVGTGVSLGGLGYVLVFGALGFGFPPFFLIDVGTLSILVNPNRSTARISDVQKKRNE